ELGSTVAGDKLACKRAHGCAVAHVGGKNLGGRCEFVRERAQSVFAPSDQTEDATLVRVVPRERGADSARCAGNYDAPHSARRVNETGEAAVIAWRFSGAVHARAGSCGRECRSSSLKSRPSDSAR